MLKNVHIPVGQFSDDFVRKMRARMVVGYYRYGHISEMITTRTDINIIETCRKRIDAYLETGNTEHLVDAANYLMIEFLYPRHPQAHFSSVEEEDPNKRLGVVRFTDIKTVETLLRVDEENEKDLLE